MLLYIYSVHDKRMWFLYEKKLWNINFDGTSMKCVRSENQQLIKGLLLEYETLDLDTNLLYKKYTYFNNNNNTFKFIFRSSVSFFIYFCFKTNSICINYLDIKSKIPFNKSRTYCVLKYITLDLFTISRLD